MANKYKRYGEVILPYETDKIEVSSYVRQHWNVTFGRQKQVSVYTKRILTLILAQIEQDGKTIRDLYQFRVEDIKNPNAPTVPYAHIKDAFDELTDLKWFFEDEKKTKFSFRHLVNNSRVECGYNNGIISIALNPVLTPYFIALSHYTTYELKWYMTFESWYSIRLFEILSACRDTGFWQIDIDKYRDLMDCNDKYDRINDLIKKTTTEPLKELERTKMAFTLEKIYEEKKPGQRGRPMLRALRFELKKVQPTKISKTWFETLTKEGQKICNELTKKWLISEANIINYGQILGVKEMKNIISQFKQKEQSNRAIDNKQAYCNKVFVARAKEMKEAQKLAE